MRAEAVSWAASLETRFTEVFEELVAYLARATDKTTVSELLGIAWRSVGAIVERVVERRLDAHRLDGLVFIGIDEFSYRKRHHYLTVIVDHIERRVVWAGEGRSSETLARFFDELGPTRAAKIECITLDMSAGYLKTIRERASQAQVVFDRFHVQRLASDAVDAVRREQMRELDDPAERGAIKRSRFALLSNPWNLSRRQGEKLRQIERHNRPLYRSYLLKETLARALDYRHPKRAERALAEWLAWASRSRLRPFVRLARTIRQHRGGILAYVSYRLTNGVVEGINNRLRMGRPSRLRLPLPQTTDRDALPLLRRNHALPAAPSTHMNVRRGKKPCPRVRELAREHLCDINAKMRELTALRSELQRLLRRKAVSHRHGEVCPMIQRGFGRNAVQ